MLFDSGWPSWLLDITLEPLGSVSKLVTGIAIGLLARRYSFWIGAAAFCAGDLFFRALDRLIFSPGVWPPIEPMWLAHSLATAAVSGGILSLSGEYLRTWWTSVGRTQFYSRLSSRTVALVVVASVIYVAVAYLAARLPEHVQFNQDPAFAEWAYIWLSSLSRIAFGVSIGWYAKADGARAGAISCGLGHLMFSVVDHILVTPYASINPFRIVHDCTVAALFGAAYALVGEYGRSGWSSSNRLESKRSGERAAQA
jgi:hypothetical protein